MIFALKRSNESDEEFIALLGKTKKYLLLKYSKKKPELTSQEFEKDVHEAMLEVSRGTPFEGKISYHGAHAFPDISVGDYYGVEVKLTASDKWKTTGNSVLESTRVKAVKDIYLFFGKFGGKMDISIRPYEDCVYDIAVTHSPRYILDLRLNPKKSIFAKMGIPYDELRKMKEPIKKIQDYYRSQLKEGEELWWLDTEMSGEITEPKIRFHKNLSPKEKQDYLVSCLVLFPELFSSKQTKYERPAAHLLRRYWAVSSNLRDIFSASGRKSVKIAGKSVRVSHVQYILYENRTLFIKRLTSTPLSELTSYWKKKPTNNTIGSRMAQWLALAEEVNPQPILSKILSKK